MKAYVCWLYVISTVCSIAQAATISTELMGIHSHENFPKLKIWEYSLEKIDASIEMPLNTELGEKGSIYIHRQAEPWMTSNDDTYMVWDFASNGNTVNVITYPHQWGVWKIPESVILDSEVASRTKVLIPAPALDTDILYSHYVDRFSMNYYNPFVYFGKNEKKKYQNVFDGENILIQNLGKGYAEDYADISSHLISKDLWISYKRHNISPEKLSLTFEDPDLIPYMVFVRGENSDLYLQPGDSTNLQALTVTLIYDVVVNKDAILNNVPMKEPALFVDLLTLRMDCKKTSAASALKNILNSFTSLSDQPAVEGKYILKLSDLFNDTIQCLNKT